jgi:preprotein translocase subunit SecA
MFETLLNTINVEIVKALSSVSINENTSADDVEQQNNDDISAIHSNPLGRKTQHEAAVMENTVSEKPSDSLCATSISVCAKSAKEVFPVWLNCCKRVFSFVGYGVQAEGIIF